MRTSYRIRARFRHGYQTIVPIAVKERIRLWRGGAPVFVDEFDRLASVFIHVPKTGGLSVASAVFGRADTGHRPVGAFVTADEARFDRYFSFGFVRNPFDRVWSAFRFLSAGGLTDEDARFVKETRLDRYSFPRFVTELLPILEVRTWIHFKPQVDWLTFRGEVRVDYVGHFESIDDDFRNICGRLGIEGAALPHMNRSADHDRRLRHVYTPEAVRIVERLYRVDLQTFGYAVPNELKPG